MLNGNLLDSIYAIVQDEDALQSLLIRVAEQFRCVSSALIYSDPLRPAADVVLHQGAFDANARHRYLTEYAVIDPAPAAIAALPLGIAAATDRLFSPEVHNSRFVTEFYNPLGLYETLAAPIAREDGRSGILAVHRGNDRPAFDDDEIETFAEIASHVIRAVALRGRFFALASVAERRADILDKIAVAVMAVEPSGQLLEANKAARDVFGRADGLMLTRSGRVRLVDRAADAALGAALSTANRSAPTIIVAPRSGEAQPYALKVTANAGSGRFAATTSLIQVADDRLPAGNIEVPLSQALGMSVSSAAVVAALLRGGDLKSYAKQAGISENTVKFHLKSAFRATGTRRQSDLIRLVVSVLRDLSL